MQKIFSQKKWRWKIGVVLSCAALSTLAVPQAHAEVLEQKWQPGQQLSYDFNLDGTLRFTTPADTVVGGFPIGGLPLEMLLKGNGQSTLDTREVDDFGSAVVVPKLEWMQMKFNETTFNQNGVFGLRDGRANFTVNGQNIGPANVDVSRFVNPDYGLRFTKSLRVTGFQPLGNAAAETPAQENTPAAEKSPLPIDFPAMIQAMITRAIPPLLPLEDVSVGDTWDAQVEWPPLPGAAAGATPKEPLGKFNFKALGEEEVMGRKTWRIATDGVLEVQDVASKAAGDALEKSSAAGGQTLPFKIPNFLSVAQKIKGDIWFDPAAGQIVKADLALNSSAAGRAAAGKATDGDMKFNGKLLMELRKTSFSGGQ